MKTTPLHQSHIALGAKMGEFAGYDMPLYYPLGVLKEHEWVRSHCGVFDVSHMGQIAISGNGARLFLESITPSSFEKLPLNKAKYTVLLNDDGGIIDDLMVTKTCHDDDYYLVINAGCKDKDIAWIKERLPQGINFEPFDWTLIAVQGPMAENVLNSVLGVDVCSIPYMGFLYLNNTMAISRLGYTGEDGFEISVSPDAAVDLWDKFLSDGRVKPIGLAARDSLRLEMGYCLYGHDIDATTTPVEADLAWIMPKEAVARFPVPMRKRVGVVLTDKGIAREGTEILSVTGEKIGVLTSGGYSPTLKQSIGQGYVPVAFATEGTDVFVSVRGNNIPAKIAKMPFLKPKTKTGK